MEEDSIPKSPADQSTDAQMKNMPDPVEKLDGNGVANSKTAPEFAQAASQIPSAEDLFSKQDNDVSQYILRTPRTVVPDFSVRLFRSRQMDWNRFSRVIGKTTGDREKDSLTPGQISRIQTTAQMGQFQFSRTVGYSFMRKSLALAYHQTSLMKSLNNNIINLGKVLEAKLEAIKLNTATPESKKAGLIGRFREELRVQTIRAAATRLRTDVGNAFAPYWRSGRNETLRTASNVFKGTENLGDAASRLRDYVAQRASRAGSSINSKLDSAVPPVSEENPIRTLARLLIRSGTRMGETPMSQSTARRLNNISRWLHTGTPSSTISSFIDRYLSTASGSEGSTSGGGDTSTADDDYGGGSGPGVRGSGDYFDQSESTDTASFYKDSRDFYQSTTAYLQRIVEYLGTPGSGRASRPGPSPGPGPGPKPGPRPTPRRKKSSPYGPPSPPLRRLTAPAPQLLLAPPPIRPSGPSFGPPPPPNEPPPSPGMGTPPPRSGRFDQARPGNPSHGADFNEFVSGTHTRGEEFGPPPPPEFTDDGEDETQATSGILGMLSRYAKLIEGLIKRDGDNASVLSRIGTSLNNAASKMSSIAQALIPKRLRKNSYDEHEGEVSEEAKEEREADDTARAESRFGRGGIRGAIGSLFNSFGGGQANKPGEGGGSGESRRSWWDTLNSIGDIGEDITTMALLKNMMGKTKYGRAALAAGALLKRPLVRPLNFVRREFGNAAEAYGRGGARAAASAGLGSVARAGWHMGTLPFRMAWGAAKLPFTLGGMAIRGGMTAAGAIGSRLPGAALSIGKGLLSRGGLLGIGSMAVDAAADHITQKGSLANRGLHTASDAMFGASLGSILGPPGMIAGAVIGSAIGNIDLVGKALHGLSHGLSWAYHSLVGTDPKISPDGKLISPGKNGFLSGMYFVNKELTGDPLKDPNRKISLDNYHNGANDLDPLNNYNRALGAVGANASSTVQTNDSLRNEYKLLNKKTGSNSLINSARASDLSDKLLNGRQVSQQPEYQQAIKLLPPYVQKHIQSSSALQFVLWSTSLQHGAQDASKIFNDNWTRGESDAEYIRKIYQSRTTRFMERPTEQRVKAYQELGAEQNYAQGVASGATSFSFAQANKIVGNPVDPLGDGTNSAPHLPSTSAAVKKRADYAISYLMRKGWNQEQASGIVANLVQESKLDPSAVGDGGNAHGIAQWHADRRANIAGAFGKPVTAMNLDQQLDAVDWELRNTEKRAGDALKNAKTAKQAGEIVSRQYERPGVNDAARAQEAENRSAMAVAMNDAFQAPTDKLGSGGPDASGGSNAASMITSAGNPSNGSAAPVSGANVTNVVASAASPTDSGDTDSSTTSISPDSTSQSRSRTTFVRDDTPAPLSTSTGQSTSSTSKHTGAPDLTSAMNALATSLQENTAVHKANQSSTKKASSGATNNTAVSISNTQQTIHVPGNDINLNKA